MSTTETPQEAAPSVAALPPPVTDYGFVRLELMGHRYREGRLSEVVVAGQPFLRLDLEGGAVESMRHRPCTASARLRPRFRWPRSRRGSIMRWTATWMMTRPAGAATRIATGMMTRRSRSDD